MELNLWPKAHKKSDPNFRSLMFIFRLHTLKLFLHTTQFHHVHPLAIFYRNACQRYIDIADLQ